MTLTPFALYLFWLILAVCMSSMCLLPLLCTLFACVDPENQLCYIASLNC